MLAFAIIIGARDARADAIGTVLRAQGHKVLPFAATAVHEWRSIDSERRATAIVWRQDPNDQRACIQDGAFEIDLGWGDRKSQGEFLSVKLNSAGDGEIRRNKSGVYGLFRAQSREGFVVYSNRASLCALAQSGHLRFEYSKQYMTACIGAGWPFFASTLFEGVQAVYPGEEPSFRGGTILAGDRLTDPWWDEALHARYENDVDGLWKNEIANLADAVGRFFDDAGKCSLSSFSLSGGKHSRLLFAALLQFPGFGATPIRTSGTLYSPDVISAAVAAAHYGLKHTVIESVFAEIDLATSIPEHLFFTEGRLPPYPLQAYPTRRSSAPQLWGHELGMREPIATPMSEYDLSAWQQVCLAGLDNFDRARILTDDAADWLRREAQAEVKWIFENSKRHDGVGWRFYIENRMLHYVTQIKEHADATSECPFPLLTDRIGELSYSIGRAAGLEERVHYEVLRRLEPWLAYDCPFAVQRWPISLRISEGLEKFTLPIPYFSSQFAHQPGLYAAIKHNREQLKTFALDQCGRQADIVSRTRLEAAFELDDWSTHGISAIMYAVAFMTAQDQEWDTISPMNREDRCAPFNASNYTFDVRVGNETAESALLRNYREVTPPAIEAIARTEQARLLLADGYALSSLGKKEEAAEMFTAAAALGHPMGHLHLGRAYLTGNGVQKNHGLAVGHINKALAEDAPGAASALAQCYENGWAVEQDLSRAKALYTDAARAGDAWATLAVARTAARLNEDTPAMWQEALKALKGKKLHLSSMYAAEVCEKIEATGKL